jgi:tRNA-Thr(GGU) m(6)t(6)A37 methyltransferase TsaA
MDKKKWFLLLNMLLIGVAFVSARADDQSDVDIAKVLKVYPIGKIVKKDGRTFVVIEKKFEPGLLGMDRLSSVTVIYWFDRNDTSAKRSILQVHPRKNMENPLTGVFATHSPVRPNLIGISRCKIVSVQGNIIEIDDIDAFDGSPVIDLKS